ncbi:MAG: glycerol-3-phosphate 1-O-acyltransferase PlsY [Holophagales bacterium]|nr:glycerol-3-phosphate 1-O-acyltransferase PlsY [Holophagales bacterium]MYG29211.1 glycerol-3-phosphate 1-O-acyltransferase PlsY [Holophagales bacterium]MYI81219.1 glycerol-3-phosphate 1-O-acyltransferase PlsY [Holophagales bacterium]
MTAAGPVAVVLAYLLGSLPWSYLIVRLHRGIDVRTIGSRSAGATNVLRASGKWAALLALLLDAAKGAGAVVLARSLEVGSWWLAAAAVAAVAGHVFPLFLGFRGGKGVATAAGVLALLVPEAALGALVVFVVMVAWKRYVSLGSISAAVALPLLVGVYWSSGAFRVEYGVGSGPALLAGTAAIAVLVIAKHRANLVRLRAGTESRLGTSPPAPEGSG